MTLAWTEKLNLGVQEIDDDHKQLVDLMNRLEVQSADGKGFAIIRATFMALIQKTEQHFEDEEAFMDSMHYPEATRHKFIHSKLLKDLKAHYEDFLASHKVSEKTFQFLTLWLRAHITIIDKKYVDHSHGAVKKIA